MGELCSSDQEQMVLVIVSMFVNGIFSRMGEQPNKAKEVDRELDAHQNLLSQLLVNNRNLCILTLAVLPHPGIKQNIGFLQALGLGLALGIRVQKNMKRVVKMTGGRARSGQW